MLRTAEIAEQSSAVVPMVAIRYSCTIFSDMTERQKYAKNEVNSIGRFSFYCAKT